MGEYVVYVNVANKQANIHRADCPFVGMHGGISREYPPTSWYLQGFDVKKNAEYAARWTGFSVREYGNCF